MKYQVFICMAASFAAFAASATEPLAGERRSAVSRMAPERLAAAHEAVAQLHKQRRELEALPGLNDYRAILHAHAEDSAHTGGTRPEMLEDAKKTGTKIIMLTDHFRPPRDFMGSWRGLRDGVLFIPGSESAGFLLYPDKSIMEAMNASPEELIEATTDGAGLIFLSHVEERMDHPMEGLTGMEVYNRHADAEDDMAVLFTLAQWVTDPVKLPELQESLSKYPYELLAVQVDYPKDYFTKWDKESATRRVVGVAANDCHHNQVFVVKKIDDENVRLGTIVDKDEDMQIMSVALRPGIPELTKGHEPGDVIASLDFDPYHISFLNVSTHILAPELTEEPVREALAAGHAYVSHDWITDATGFRFTASTGALMGDEILLGENQPITLEAQFPLECTARLMRNGEEVIVQRTADFSHEISEPGAYRIEGWVEIDGEMRPWIYSNPIYVR